MTEGGLAENQLNVSLKDLLHAEEAGRWWIVGSAWQAALSGDDGGEGNVVVRSDPGVKLLHFIVRFTRRWCVGEWCQ